MNAVDQAVMGVGLTDVRVGAAVCAADLEGSIYACRIYRRLVSRVCRGCGAYP